ncbi:MAG: hypothetical protein A4E53_01997 [Pelotomaculum sp. PtaB.Bin104]|nr:MAG: hypothetical protein A4E53_01997 [Pelotomaculum sp. PtaB.Bin104]
MSKGIKYQYNQNPTNYQALAMYNKARAVIFLLSCHN